MRISQDMYICLTQYMQLTHDGYMYTRNSLTCKWFLSLLCLGWSPTARHVSPQPTLGIVRSNTRLQSHNVIRRQLHGLWHGGFTVHDDTAVTITSRWSLMAPILTPNNSLHYLCAVVNEPEWSHDFSISSIAVCSRVSCHHLMFDDYFFYCLLCRVDDLDVQSIVDFSCSVSCSQTWLSSHTSLYKVL